MNNIYFISTEYSGNLIMQNIISHIHLTKTLKQANNHKVNICGFIANNNIEKQLNKKSLFDISKLNIMGFIEILPHIFTIKKLINLAANDVVKTKADILVTIDSPSFTYRVAKIVRKLNPNIKLIHIVAPSVWAYKPGRAKKYAELYDKLLTILPFEAPYFTKFGLNTIYIGHPILEQQFSQNQYLNKENNKERNKIIGITLGSRKNEILKHIDIIVKSLIILQKELKQKKINLQIIIIQNNNEFTPIINKYFQNSGLNFWVSTNRLSSFSKCDFILAKSGTNTLEIAASSTPLIVFYKINYLSYLLIKNMIKIKFVNLINIIASKQIIPELIQHDFNIQNIVHYCKLYLTDNKLAKKQIAECNDILKIMGMENINNNNPPSKKAMQNIINIYNE